MYPYFFLHRRNDSEWHTSEACETEGGIFLMWTVADDSSSSSNVWISYDWWLTKWTRKLPKFCAPDCLHSSFGHARKIHVHCRPADRHCINTGQQHVPPMHGAPWLWRLLRFTCGRVDEFLAEGCNCITKFGYSHNVSCVVFCHMWNQCTATNCLKLRHRFHWKVMQCVTWLCGKSDEEMLQDP